MRFRLLFIITAIVAWGMAAFAWEKITDGGANLMRTHAACTTDPLAAIFALAPPSVPDDDFRFRLGLAPRELADVFSRSSDADRVLAERRLWLSTSPELYLACLPEARASVEELADIVSSMTSIAVSDRNDPLETLRQIGETLEPDLVLLTPNGRGEFAATAGCVCFPTGWRLTDKLGLSMPAIHEIVPGLNAIIGDQIDRVLTRLRSGQVVSRLNLTVCGVSDYNQHPDRAIPPLNFPTLDGTWLRIEEQTLFSLAKSGAIVFSIRIHHFPWRDVCQSKIAPRVARILRTMPIEMLDYKRLSAAAPQLIRWLEE